MDLLLEVPIRRAEARVRGIDATAGRMNITANETDGRAADVLWNATERCRPTHLDTFVYAIGEFVQLAQLAAKFPTSVGAPRALLDLGLVQIPQGGGGSTVLSMWEAEMLVLFHATIEVAKTVIVGLACPTEKWWHLGTTAPEAPFLRQLDTVDRFFLYSSTRSALEILGTKRSVFRSLDSLRVLFDS